ncbi:MAG: MFS transporter [Chloroflexota bacterium]|nr:MFS transporter [Chloroflexota bacterium]
MRTIKTSGAASGLSSYWSRIAAVLSESDFRWYWLSSSTQGLAIGTQFLVIGWLVLEVTESSAQLGLVIFLYGAPNVAFLLIAGVIADRFDRRYVLIATQGSVGVIITVLAGLTIADMVAIWHVYTAAFLMGFVQSLSMPARFAIIGDIVKPSSILDAVAMQNMAVHAGRMVGPPVAGVIIEVWGIGAGLCVVAATYVASVVFVTGIRKLDRTASDDAESVFRNFSNGLVYIKNNSMILTVIIVSCAFGGFGMSHMQVVPAIAKDTLGVGAADIGLLFFASGIGSLAGSLYLPTIGRAHVYRALLASLLVFTVVLSLFAWSNWFWATWVFFLLVGVTGVGMVWPLATTMIQLETSPEVRGRVLGVLQFTPGLHFLGAFPLALAAGQLGWEVAITAAAGLSMATTVWFALLRPGRPEVNRQKAAVA